MDSDGGLTSVIGQIGSVAGVPRVLNFAVAGAVPALTPSTAVSQAPGHGIIPAATEQR